jgi:hypothetical protein
MSDQIEDIVENLKQSSVWVRILLMIGFAFVLYMVILPAIIILTIAQALFVAITGDPNRNLSGLGSLIEQYVSQIIAFVTYNSEYRPFPFSEFPSEELSKEVESPSKSESAKKKSGSTTEKKSKQSESKKSETETKSTVKKAVKKKAPAKKAAKTSPATAADKEAANKDESSATDSKE